MKPTAQRIQMQPIPGLGDRMLRMLMLHERVYGKPPRCFIVGPHEYFTLCFEDDKKRWELGLGSGLSKTKEFAGIPIELKASPGVELGIEQIQASQAMWMLEKQK